MRKNFFAQFEFASGQIGTWADEAESLDDFLKSLFGKHPYVKKLDVWEQNTFGIDTQRVFGSASESLDTTPAL